MARAATMADSVGAAEQRFHDAEQGLADAKDAADAVYAKLLRGEVVAPELFSASQHAVERATLIRDGAAEALQQAQVVARLARIRAIVEPLADDHTLADQAKLDAAAAAIEAATRDIISITTERRQTITRAMYALRKEGVPPRTAAHRHAARAEAEKAHGGVAWADAGFGSTERVFIDGKEIKPDVPASLISDALRRGVGHQTGLLTGISGYGR